MYRIRVFSDFCSSSDAKQKFENAGSTDPFVFVDDDSYTYALILNTATPVLKIPKEKVLGLAFEPNCFLTLDKKFQDYAKQNIGAYFIGIKGDLPEPFVEHYSFMWNHGPRTTPFHPYSDKKKGVSLVLSSKKQTGLHNYRHQLVNRILKTNLPVDIWGTGSREHGKDPRLKGPFQDLEPYHVYKYSVVIENSLSKAYISEKYKDPLMSNCIPLYLGASDIDQYFGDGFGYRLTGCLEDDFNLIRKIALNPDEYRLDLAQAYLNLTQGKCYLPTFLQSFFT